ncbi:MAG: RES family NAD+ phosphorylase [Mycobacteriales bacterium]|nr:RES family NAD+ phosphorylase [Mycobacteriales bacterium]
MSPAARASRRTPWPVFTTGDWRGTHRLVPATYVDRTEPYLAALVDADSADPDGDIAALTTLAAATNDRLRAQADLPGLALGTHELVYDVDWSQVVNGAFAYPGQGGRFHDQSRGAWYAGIDVETSLEEVTHHRAVALAEIDVWEDEGEWQDFRCDVGGDHVADLRDGSRRTAPCLDPVSYIASQRLALELLEQGAAGVVWPSVRHAGGTCVVVFRPALLPPVRLGSRWRLTWSGSARPEVTELGPPQA